MQHWVLWHGQDGYEVELVEVPWWALAVSSATVAVDVATGHLFCGSRGPDWLWCIPVGRARWSQPDTEGCRFLENSLQGNLYNLFSWGFCADLRHARSLHRFRIQEDVALALGAKTDQEDD
jgi:hypothetical protein